MRMILRITGEVATFLSGMQDVAGAHELPLLDVDGFAGAARFEEQVGLTAEERGNLKNIDRFGGWPCL